MFIDIDFSEENPAQSVVGFFQKLRGAPQMTQEERYTQKVVDWAAQHPDLGLRIYRTFGGLRCLITNRKFDPKQPDAIEILRTLNSDPLYIRLCQAQSSFRARLTPKPWRCEVPRPPAVWPFQNNEIERHFKEWLASYQQVARNFTVCRFVRAIGMPDPHPEAVGIVNLHDSRCVGAASLPLA